MHNRALGATLSTGSKTSTGSHQAANDRLVLPVVEAAPRLGISRWTLYRRLKDKANPWPSVRIGRQHHIHTAFVDAYQDALRRGRSINLDDFAREWRANAEAKAEVAV